MMDTQKKNGNVMIGVMVVLLLPFLSIYSIRTNMTTQVYQFWQIFSVGFLLLILFSIASEIKFNWVNQLFLLYQATILLSTFLNHGFSAGILTVTAAAILIFMLLQTSYYYEIIAALSFIVIVSAILNVPSLLAKRNEINANFFIGGKNYLSMFLIPGAFLILLNAKNRYEEFRKKDYVAVAFCIISVLIGSSGTGIVVSVISAILLILSFKIIPSKRVYVGVILVFYVLFILFAEEFFKSEFWISFTDLLGKDSTLTSRTMIWEGAKERISQNWVFGAGRGTGISFIGVWGEQQDIYEAHNFVLEILMEGGFVALAFYSALLYKVVKVLDFHDIKNRMIFIALCIILINGLTESTLNNFFVTIILGIACRYAAENRGNIRINEQQI